MTTFGKVLAILNVVGAVGFIWLAALEYGKHQAWAFQVQQGDFILQGLPVDETEKNADGDVVVNLIGNRMLQQLFSGAGQAVKTQAEEVKKRQSDVLNAVNAEQGAQAKKAKLEEIVLPLAGGAAERANLREQIQKANEPELSPEGPFLGPNSLFAAAFNEANKTELSLEPRRNAIARFLFGTSSSQQDYQRTLVVVGLDHYSREVERQASALQSMLAETELVMAADRKDFEKNHRDLIEQIKAQAERVRGLQGDLERQNAQLQQYNVMINDRKGDGKDLRSQIQSTQDATKAALAKQSEFEKALFTAQKEVATTNAANQRLEEEIKARELRSSGGERP
jgi:hypothetical protein